MEASAYEALAKSENNAWYYLARIRAVEYLVRCFAPRTTQKLRIIDIGCGTGGSTQALQKYGDVTGLEPSALARHWAQLHYPQLKILPIGIDQLRHEQVGNFDVAVMLCVLYHRNVSDPKFALETLSKIQKPGAILVWNEPAYGFLWRQHDRQTASGRRFQPSAMRLLLKNAGYELVFSSHLLAWAFPIAATLALIDRWRWGQDRQSTDAAEGADHRPVPVWLNKLLKVMTYAEWRLNAFGMGLPFGVSYLLVARKICG